jgi:hypothetical protein
VRVAVPTCRQPWQQEGHMVGTYAVGHAVVRAVHGEREGGGLEACIRLYLTLPMDSFSA